MNISEKEALSLQQHFLNIPEPRNPRGVRHHKISLLVIALCAILSNAQSFVAIAEWAKRCSQNMLKRLRCRFNPETKRYEPPSEPTLRRFLQAVDAEAVDQQLSAWLCTLSNPEDQPTNNLTAIAVDGKTLKGARQNQDHRTQLLSAFLHQQGMVLAQQEVASHTNEIPVIQPLLAPLDLHHCVVTVDALHTQKETARFLVEEKGADYLMTVKENQPSLRRDIECLQMEAFPPSVSNHR